MIFKDQFGYIIDYMNIERQEQIDAEKYITSDCVVLELGARYGTVSCTINKKLSNQLNQVSVEPDVRVYGALEKNMISNDCNFHIVKGVISRTPIILENLDSWHGYGTSSAKAETSSIQSYTLEQIEEKYNLKFNTLVADCEGFLEQFFEENPNMYKSLKLILFEKDYPDKCNYSKIENNLRLNGFKPITMRFQSVWKKSE